MALLQVKTNNPQFSFLIAKNPDSGMLIKPVRLGRIFGWYSDLQTYNCYFKDAPNEISYKQHPDEQFEYINTSRYNSALFVLNTITEFFSKNLKTKDTEEFEYEIKINLLLIKAQRYIEFFNQHFNDFSIEAEELANKNYRISLKTKKSFHALLHYTCLFVLFNSLRNRDYLPLEPAMIEKYLGSLKEINSPYFIRYIFKINLLNRIDLFNKYKNILESESIKMSFGSSLESRISEIKSRLSFNLDILDIGCGEGNYAIPFSKKLEGKTYYATDRDTEKLEILSRKKQRFELSNLEIISDSDIEWLLKDTEVIFTEVLEHNPIEASTDLIKNLLKNQHIKKIIITTPNKDFNVNYLFEEDELRHEDHQFEFTKEEFQNWGKQFNASFFDCGDLVNGVPVTLGAVILGKKL